MNLLWRVLRGFHIAGLLTVQQVPYNGTEAGHITLPASPGFNASTFSLALGDGYTTVKTMELQTFSDLFRALHTAKG